MIKFFKKIQFSNDENRMKSIANTKIARELYYSSKSNNVRLMVGHILRFDPRCVHLFNNTKKALTKS